ncbi:Rho GTPase activation protein [Gamsiella multidivaricata]|uniref:Rho GTPase activation protein n=1 Tax=Gamsiella multidivaricata TaxID=101098 RepID=UPI00222010E1|nr:Rho GTPase activation protein [Gamsiella multidivaricata]KAI7826576.1 Rho GTPase activation protein [Gamsiella multidivaricata]
MSHIPGTPMVPAVLYRCAEYLEAKGIDEVGLYRVPGSHASVQKLKKMFDTGKDINLLAMDAIDPNDIATLLKLYLRELPSSLLPAVFLEQFQSVISTDRQVCHSLRGILVRLPRPNYVMLSFLCHHLSRIAAHSEKTKMNVSNLGVVFAPTLSIGSVLFKALLGGYYDTADTFENRENGLKLVWGGLLQECDFGVQEWPEDSANHAYQPVDQSALQSPLTPAQEIVQATLAVPAIPSEPAVSESIPRDLPCTPVVTLATPEESIFIAPGTIEDEEAKLMAAMLLREEMSTKQQDYDETVSDVSSSSDSIPCTDTTALSAVSSPGLNVKEHVFEAAFTSPSMTFSPTLASTAAIPSSATDECDNLSSPPPSSESSAIPELDQKPLCSSTPLSSAEETTAPVASTTATTAVDATYPTPPTINIIIDSGSLLLPESTPTSAKVQPELKVTMDKAEYKEDESEEDEEETAVVGPEFSPKIASEAPQLPPLEGLMIAL